MFERFLRDELDDAAEAAARALEHQYVVDQPPAERTSGIFARRLISPAAYAARRQPSRPGVANSTFFS